MEVKSIFLSALVATTTGGMAVGGYYFVKPKYIKDLLLKEGKNLLDTSESSTKDDDKWEKLVKKHNEGTTPIKLKNAKEIKKLVTSSDQTTIDKNKLKEECKKLLNKEIDNKAKEEDIEKATNWCTEKSPLLTEENKNSG